MNGVGLTPQLTPYPRRHGADAAMLGRIGEALTWLDDAGGADPTDVLTHVIIHRARSRLALAGGDLDEADRLAAAATRLLEDAEAALDQAEQYILWSDVHRARGDTAEAHEALEAARSLFEAKGATAAVWRVDILRGVVIP